MILFSSAGGGFFGNFLPLVYTPESSLYGYGTMSSAGTLVDGAGTSRDGGATLREGTRTERVAVVHSTLPKAQRIRSGRDESVYSEIDDSQIDDSRPVMV